MDDHEQSPSVLLLAKKLRNTSETDTDFAINAFNYTRDKIAYVTFGSSIRDITPEDTFKWKKGNCYTKSTFLVALLRAGGLEAAYCALYCELRPYIESSCPDFLIERFPPKGPHLMATVTLNGKRLVLDSTFDSKLVRRQKLFRDSGSAHDFHFDGCHSACCPASILKPVLGTQILYPDNLKRWFNLKFDKLDKFTWQVDIICKEFFRKDESEDRKQMESSLQQHLLFECPEFAGNFQIPSPPKTENVKYCDFNHPKIRKLVRLFRSKTSTEAGFIASVFRFVKDEILFTFMPNWSVPVEYTLSSRIGMCSTKACLLAAILTAGGIPNSFCTVKLNGIVGAILPKFITDCMGKMTFHCHNVVYCNGRWLKLDCSFDHLFSLCGHGILGEKVFPDSKFDGTSDCIATKIYDGDMRFTANLDLYMSKRSQVPHCAIDCANIAWNYSRFLAGMFKPGHAIPFVEAVEEFLIKHHSALVAKCYKHASRKRILKSKI